MMTFTKKYEVVESEEEAGKVYVPWLELVLDVSGLDGEREVALGGWLFRVDGYSPEVEVDWGDGSPPERFELPEYDEMGFVPKGPVSHAFGAGAQGEQVVRIYGEFGWGPGMGFNWDKYDLLKETLVEVRVSDGKDIVDNSGWDEEEVEEEYTHRFFIHAKGAGVYRLNLRPWLAVSMSEGVVYVNWGDGDGYIPYGVEELRRGDGVVEHEFVEGGVYEARLDVGGVAAHAVAGDDEAEEAEASNGYALKMVGYGAFAGCRRLRAVPEGLLHDAANNSKSDFWGLFSGCEALSAVPMGLFANFGHVKEFLGTFADSGLEEIPTGLFAACRSAEVFCETFTRCTRLKSVPGTLIGACPKVRVFNYVFTGCTGLERLPAGLFINNALIEDFAGAFSNCTGLTILPEDLFSKNAAAKTFDNTFNGCTSLASVPEGLFAGCPEVESFAATFQSTAIAEVPWDFFTYNTKVRNFNYCFSLDHALKKVSCTMFYCTEEGITFDSMFGSCVNLESVASGWPPGAASFKRTFRNCYKLSILPPLWSNFPQAAHEECFVGCTSASNYAQAERAGWV